MKLGLRQSIYNAEIRSRRLALGLSQKQLGEKIGVGAVSITHLECLHRVNPGNRTLARLAAFFGVAPEVLCPPWLSMIEGVQREVFVEREFTAMSLESEIALRALPAPDRTTDVDQGIEWDWLVKAAPRLLTPRQLQGFALKVGLNGIRMPDAAIAAQMGVTPSAVRSYTAHAKKVLAEAWAQKQRGVTK